MTTINSTTEATLANAEQFSATTLGFCPSHPEAGTQWSHNEKAQIHNWGKRIWKLAVNTALAQSRQPSAQGGERERADWLQESSYRAGAKAGYNLGVDENSEGLAALLEAHRHPRPATPPATSGMNGGLPRRIFEHLQGYMSATFSWQGDDPDEYALAKNAHDEKCIALIAKEIAAALPPPGRGMVPMTEEKLREIWHEPGPALTFHDIHLKFARAIEAAHGIQEGL